jgi:hypothetical protein
MPCLWRFCFELRGPVLRSLMTASLSMVTSQHNSCLDWAPEVQAVWRQTRLTLITVIMDAKIRCEIFGEWRPLGTVLSWFRAPGATISPLTIRGTRMSKIVSRQIGFSARREPSSAEHSLMPRPVSVRNNGGKIFAHHYWAWKPQRCP